MKQRPYVPATVPIAGSQLASQWWIQFFNALVANVSELILRGTRAEQPAASSVVPGTLYYVTDEQLIEYSDGVSWQDFSAASAGLLTIRTSDPASPADDTAWLFRDGASPQGIELRLRIAGVTYSLPMGTIG